MERLSVDYRETVDLLQCKLIMYIRLNASLNRHIRYKTRFVISSEKTIQFNFIEFSEAYRAKHIDGKLEDFSLSFIEFIKPVLKDFIREINYGGYHFRVVIRYNAETFEKVFSILSDNYDYSRMA